MLTFAMTQQVGHSEIARSRSKRVSADGLDSDSELLYTD